MLLLPLLRDCFCVDALARPRVCAPRPVVRLVSVSPLGLDLTHHDLLGKLPGWRVAGFEAVIDEELRGGGAR